jgi:glycyl-tRNA synthetase beta subunit
VATFLLEIGTDELPADFVRTALPQLEALVRRDLADLHLSHGTVRSLGTPRRLAIQVEQLSEQQEDRVEERKGPPEGQAFQDGRPTAAAEGFARRCGIDPAHRLCPLPSGWAAHQRALGGESTRLDPGTPGPSLHALGRRGHPLQPAGALAGGPAGWWPA